MGDSNKSKTILSREEYEQGSVQMIHYLGDSEFVSFPNRLIRRSFTIITGIEPKRAQLRTRIELPPGTRMMRVAKIFVSKKHNERVLEPLVADWRDEYFEAVDEKASRLQLIAIHVRNVCYFLTSLGLLSAIKVLIKLIKSMSSS